MIPIVYHSGEEGLVSAKFLDILLYLGQVERFKRSGGWVLVGIDPLRSLQSATNPNESERRHHRPTLLPIPLPSNSAVRSSMLKG